MKHDRITIIVLGYAVVVAAASYPNSLYGAQVKMIPHNSEPEESLKFSEKICQIAKRRNAQINFLYSNSLAEEEVGLEEVMHKLELDRLHQCLVELPILIRSLDLYAVEPERASGSLNIFLITTSQVAHRVLQFINPHQRWKHGHRYLFVWLLPDSDLLKLTQFFRKLWQKQIIHAAAVLDSQRVLTFEPFSPEGFRLKTIDENQYCYYDKLKNFHHYEVRITMFTDPIRAVPLPNYSRQGYKRIDGRVASALVKYLNATARYITPADNETYGALYRNGTFTGSLKDIHSGLTHIGFNLRYTLDHVKEHIEELYPYQRRFLYLVVPAAKMRPEYMIFVKAFSTSLWRLLLLNFVIVLILFLILQHLVEHLPQSHGLKCSPKHWLWFELIEVFWKTQLGEPVEGFSRISSLRQFLIAWILFSYVLTSMYFAKLESNFVQPTYGREMDSLEELPQLNVPIYAFDIVFEAIKVSLQPQYYEMINARGVRVPPNVRADEFAFSVTQKNDEVALMLHDEMAKELLAHSYNDATKRPSYHIVKEYLRTLTSSYVVTKGSPFIHKFQVIVSAFHEFGLMHHWMQVDSHKSYTHKSDEFFEDLEDDFDLNDDEDGAGSAPATPVQTLRHKKVVLSLDILQGAFYLWLSGILISCVGFAAEWGHWWRRREQRRLVSIGIQLEGC